MDKNTAIWQQYYEKSLNRKHSPRTEFAVKLNESGLNVAIDCGCGTGSDVSFLNQQGYQVHGFDINPDSISICDDRFSDNAMIDISQASFESFNYPQSGVIIANSSLFFAEAAAFESTWLSIESNLQIGGVFSGDFMGENDSWAKGYRSDTAPLTKQKISTLFENFEIIRFHERDEQGNTSLGKTKWWHTFSVVAVKRT
ncbi:methyltransferase domain-containing protein [Moritella marina ATCC 15381]|uniref:Methyltransferase domain-containing protein n=1 Tax=Moritella marina ATCC 15381 TaxID=1202962 RepID=A0A5J6WFQ0_MORMI|nr:methyltransferase domain-containing protein [Moritella marina]QFI36767.1 methyltransferase domain-containing protein [Moritella marina ATCC 15381]